MDPDPEVPGRKMHVSSYIQMERDDVCLCGSGKLFGHCCLTARERPVLVPDPGERGYSHLVEQSATFDILDWAALRERLMEEEALHGTEESTDRGFWVLWGDPPVETEHGIVCFGDIEAVSANTPVAAALSHARMHSLLEVLHATAPECLGAPTIERRAPLRVTASDGRVSRRRRSH
jgi:hypothetical protein